jgi:glutathione S-transferase
MTIFILHHHVSKYDEAAFAEKVRLVFGLKEIAWHSVIQSSVMPQPDLLALTGGYQRTPVLQIGADIFCDPQLIIAEIERRQPLPTLFPDGNPGLANALSAWAHGPYAVGAVALYLGAVAPYADDLSRPQNFHEDHEKMWLTQFDNDQLKHQLADDLSWPQNSHEDHEKMWLTQFDNDQLKHQLKHQLAGYRSRLHAQTDFLRQQLADGRPFMTGEAPGLVDLHALWNPWFLRRFAPAEAQWAYDPYPEIVAWEARLTALGHGQYVEMTPADALSCARTAEPAAPLGVDPNDPLNIPAGTPVTVSPTDYAGVPVAGKLVATTVQSVSIQHHDPDIGNVVVHFPRIGYEITAA